MSDVQATETGQEQTDKPTEGSINYRELSEQLTKQLESTKNELSSRDSKIGEYQKTLTEYKTNFEEQKNANLSETEKLNLKLKELELNVQAERSERTRATNKAEAIKLMNDLKIDTDLIGLVPLDDMDNMKKSIEILSNSAKKQMQQGAQTVVSKLGSDVPTGAQPTGGMVTMSQYKQMSMAEQNRVLTENRLQT